MVAKSMKYWILPVYVLVMEELATTTSTSHIRRSRALQTFKNLQNDQSILFNETKSCATDCVCYVSEVYRTAKCNRLEMGIQKFSEDITDLVIHKAKIDIQLGDFIFKKLGLQQIQSIKILHSNITSIGVNAFHGLARLYMVDLSYNNLKDIHPEIFATNKMLLLLTLSHNLLTFPATDTLVYFLNASSVQEFDISYCNMRYITKNTLKNMPGIMYLNLAGNNLFEIEDFAFKALIDLEEIDLSHNNIKSLPKDIFSENSELTTLSIQKNPIDSVDGLKTSDLLTLNAGETNINNINPSMFNDMAYIANLNLSGNNINKINNQAFHKLLELNYLDISFNNLEFISNYIIKENTQLNIFKISNNLRLKHLPFDGFDCSVEQFKISIFDVSNCGLEEVYENTFKTFGSLIQVNLSDNKIKLINRRVFYWCPKLLEINLAHNLLTYLYSKIFEKNKELAILNLQGNPLKVFSVEVFVYTPMLNWLDISHAELTNLWNLEHNQSRTLLKNLRFLNVSHNYIIEIKQTELVTLKNLKTLDITNNLLTCSREFNNTMNWLSRQNISLNNYEFSSDSMETIDNYTWDNYIRKICKDPEFSTSTLSTVILSTNKDEEKWKLEDVSVDGNNYNITKINNDDTKQNAYNEDTVHKQIKENDEVIENEPDDVDCHKIREQLNTESRLNTNIDTKNSYVWPIIMTILSAMLFLINVIIFVRYYYKRKNVSHRINLMHQTTQDSQTATGMPLLRIHSVLAE